MARTVLVTGGSGFIAGWCIRLLLARGFSVRTTLRNPAKAAGLRAVLGGAPDIVIADLTKDEGWDAAAEGWSNAN